jgi:hypothetical protein
MADCLLFSETQKVPETLASDFQVRVIRSRSGIAVALIQAQRNEWILKIPAGYERPLAV